MVTTLLGNEISSNQREGPTMHSRLPYFCPILCLGGGGEGEDFFFIFPWFPMCSPTCSPQHLTFLPYALANIVLLSPIYLSQREGTLYFQIEPSILWRLHSFIFVFE